jgi:Amidase
LWLQAKLKELGQSLEISSAVFFGMEGMPNLLSNPYNPKKSLNLYMEIVKSCFGLSKLAFSTLALYFLRDVNCFIPKSKFQHYMDKNDALSKKLSLLLGEDSVLLYPSHPTPAGFHHEMYVKTSGVLYSMAMNTLGLPATQVPVGLNDQGLPLGFQVRTFSPIWVFVDKRGAKMYFQKCILLRQESV